MARLLDQVVVIDVESTCWDGDPPPGQTSEIIEIGVCTVEVATAHRLVHESMLVRPERSQVSAFCTALTTLTPEQVDGGISFVMACAHLRSPYRSKERLWASYGDYDRRQFERQCVETGVPYPFGPSHLNIKSLFGIMQGLPRELGMAEALELLHLPLAGTHHRAGDDAWNIGGILANLLERSRS